MSKFELRSGSPSRLGACHDGDGVNFAVFSHNATGMDLCIFSDDGTREIARLPLRERTGPIWHGYLPNLPIGTLYGYRAHGAYAPEQGHRFNPNKLLMDPYTRELRGRWINDPVLLGYDEDAPGFDLSFDERDSALCVPKSVVSDPQFFEELANRPVAEIDKDDDRDLIYEAHVRGLSQTHSGVPESLRGTYEGLASNAMIEHLQSLGVSAIELLPVHSFLDDKFLLQRGLTNYWGYNTIGFFAPEPRYFGPAGIIGFRNMVDKLRRNGIIVILDVVYNHTAEGDHRGPTLCYRGLDNASYYRLQGDDPRYYVNDTGCGNTLNVSHPNVLRMVLDSLRFWVQVMGVGGFRFDLATTLGREDDGFDINGGFFDVLRQDPVLANVRLIAEPWDIGPGGYRLGEFPPEFSEWNDKFRDGVRKYWRGDTNSAQELAAGLLGSAVKFDHDNRRAWSSLNFVSSHDGFTLADICRYNERHNLANGEDNRDGHSANYSDNCGIEDNSDDKEIAAKRHRRQRNILATLFLSQGTPMLLAGDEIGNSQNGNNNAYCQDNEIGWLNWDKADDELQKFVVTLSEFRRAHKCLRQSRFLHGAKRINDGNKDVEWTDFEGRKLPWHDQHLSGFCLTVRQSGEAPQYEGDDDAVFIIFNRQDQAVEVTLPAIAPDQYWQRGIDTARDEQGPFDEICAAKITVEGHSVVALGLSIRGVDHEN